MLTDISKINEEAKRVYEQKFCPIFKKHLKNNGFTDEHLNIIKDDIASSCLSPVGNNLDDMSGDFDVDSIRKEIITKISDTAKDFEKNTKLDGEIITLNAKQKEKEILSKIQADSYIVQNANVSLSRKEQLISEHKFTNPVNLQDANYSVTEDYPNTYGFIDTVKNWFKINKKKGFAEFVHQSGSYFKIDKNGNASFYISGSLKQIVEKDYTIEVRNNMDTLVKKSNYTHVIKNDEKLVGGTLMKTILGKVTNIFKSTLDETVSGNVNENYGASSINNN